GFSARPRDFSVPPLAAASVPPEEAEVRAQPPGEDQLLAAAASHEQMDEAEQLAFSSRTLIEGQDFAMPALATASLPPGVTADSADAELVHASLPRSAPANDVGEPQKPEEDFSDLALPDERKSSRGAAAPQERVSPPPLPTTGRRSIAPRTRTSPPPLPFSRARAEAEARQFGSQPPLATATEPPPGAAALSSPLPPSVDSHTSPGGYVAITPDDEAGDSSKRIRAPLQRTAVPPPFAPDAPPLSVTTDVDTDAARGVELVANTAPPPVTSTARPEDRKPSEPAGADASAQSAAWLRAASAPIDMEARKSLAAKPRDEQAPVDNRSEADARTAAAKNGESANTRGDTASPPDAAKSATPKISDPAPTTSGHPQSPSQRPQKTSNVLSFVPRKRAEDAAASGSGEPGKMDGDAAPSPSASQGVWGGTSGAPTANSQAAPRPKRRISRWVQAGGAAATVALAAGLFALRARDAAPQGSLNTAVPQAVETPAIVPPTAANDVKEQALEELEAMHNQAQALPEPQPQPTAAAPTPQTEPKAAEPAAAPQQQPAPATAEPAKQQPTPDEQAAKPASEAPSNADQVLAKGRSLEQRGKKQDAINLYAKAAEEGSANSQMLSRMAFLYLNQGKNALAETAAKRAADADETNSEAWIVLGAALDGLGKKPAAEQAYRNCAQKGQGQYVTECKRMLR
ncbi:MAG TPA: hypothetical protein VMF89_01360, partial [Polyangiales bacterium]|nr:hypothetical protein [Polyangiales bacterium]